MTSRPSLGLQQRQAQRTLSGSGLSQRAAQQRNLPHQYLPQSPIRDFSPSDPNDAAQSRYSLQRRGGSRLKLELSHDSADGAVAHVAFAESPNNALGSPKPVTPSRLVPPTTDALDVGEVSPRGVAMAQIADANSNPLPMPPRRPRFSLPGPPIPSPVPNAVPAKKDMKPKPYTYEIPPAAPRYSARAASEQRHAKEGSTAATPSSGRSGPSSGHADFYPWTGEHAEDKFSEHVIRHGYFDKAPVAQTETSSAKNVLFSSLRNKSGLHALSTVFTGVLGQRRHSGRITNASTFKPPPRVTLTDTKREMWLKDLANPAIPLRRLSRTIPHGIRGRVLLDQCLNKCVPVNRAIWLTKCVGANEIRAFKRKGVNGTSVMGGEAKWIRDWTVLVEQFVESVFSAFGAAEWKSRVNYAVRLATHLYAETLLDRDHYIEWLICGLEKSPQAKLPVWILIAQIYWKDILQMRRSGRKLVAALLGHLHSVHTNPDKDILAPISARLTWLLSNLMATSPENFVSPATWFRYREALSASLPPGDELAHARLQRITHRNESVVASGNRSRPAARHIFVKLLDSTLQSFMSDDLPARCWDVARDKSDLARALLEWCTSLYRSGLAKIYVAQRVLLSWSAMGVDATAAILDFLDSDALAEPDRRSALYHLVCALVRSGLFSVPSYAQWLIARGGIAQEQDVLPQGPCGTRLLVELPPHALTDSQRALRSVMLRRASFSTEDEARNVDVAIACLKSALGLHGASAEDASQERPPSMPVRKFLKRIGMSSYSLKAEVSTWLRDTITAGLSRMAKDDDRGPDISHATFQTARAVFESAGDFLMLADVLRSLSGVSNVDVLASCTDTLSRHLPIFAALGVARELFDAFHDRLKCIAEEQGIGARPLLASLAGLAPRMPDSGNLADQLKKSLARSDRANPVDACSPVSDNMGARLHDNDNDLHDEIEKHLANGTTLDRTTMGRLFDLVTTKLQHSWGESADSQRAYSLLLARLRVFDAQHFDSLMARWVSQVRALSSRPAVSRMFSPLVSVGCLGLPLLLTSTFADPTVGMGGAPARTTTVAGPSAAMQIIKMTCRTRYVQEVLEFMVMPLLPDSLVTVEECYRIAILHEQAQRENSNEILALLRMALAEYSLCRDQDDADNLPLDNPHTKDCLVGVLRFLAWKDATAVSRALAVRSSDPLISGLIDCLTTKLLIPTADQSTQVSFQQLLELTDEFTLPFCQLKLSLSLALGDQGSSDASERLQSHLELFAKAMDSAVGAKNIKWVGMLSSLGPDVTHDLKIRAQSRFLDLVPSGRSPLATGHALEQNLQMAENLLSVIDTVARGGSTGCLLQLVPAVVDKLADLWEVMASSQAADRAVVIRHWLPSLLTFVTLHAVTPDADRCGNEIQAKVLVVLCGIMQELDLAQGEGVDRTSTRALADRIFDLALVLADGLADETRAHCVRAVKDASSDARLHYIFSFARPPAENLMLSHKEKQQVPGRAAGANGAGGFLGAPAALWGQGTLGAEKLSLFQIRRWELLNEPTPNVGENDTALSLGLFEARKLR